MQSGCEDTLEEQYVIKVCFIQWEAVAPKLEGFWSGEFGAGGER